jgi:hypothetical protein
MKPDEIATNLAGMRATASGHSLRELTAVALADLVIAERQARTAFDNCKLSDRCGRKRADEALKLAMAALDEAVRR